MKAAWISRLFDPSYADHAAPESPAATQRVRIAIFIIVFLLVAGGGLIYDFSRPAVYRASARLSVDPPGIDDAAMKAQFAVSEAVALRRSEFVEPVMQRLGADRAGAAEHAAMFERQLSTEAIPQTNVIELRAEGGDPSRLVEAVGVWIQAYQSSRKETDRKDEGDTLADARHALKVAEQAVDGKRREMDAYRVAHGITSTERDENPSTARLKGLNTALNDAATKEVHAESRLKAIEESVVQGRGYVRAADKTAIANLELRAVDLRDRIKDLEQDYTSQYLALDPKFKALKANLARIEQQIETEKQRSLKAALAEAQEEVASARQASQKIREQSEALKQASQTFSGRFAEVRRMALDLEQLQEARRTAVDRVRKLESSQKPSAVRIQVLTAPTAGPDPVAPQYGRDAGYALGAGFLCAVGAVWLSDYLRRKPSPNPAPVQQPIIQIAYPALESQPASVHQIGSAAASPVALLESSVPKVPAELAADDVSAMWQAADSAGRLLMAALFAGMAPGELAVLRWKDVDLDAGCINVAGASARQVPLVPPMREELLSRRESGAAPESLVIADGSGSAWSSADMDNHLMMLAHDAGLRHAEEVTAGAVHFTYAAFLVRQGMRMTDLAATVGRLSGDLGAALMRLSPPGRLVAADSVTRIYPSFSRS